MKQDDLENAFFGLNRTKDIKNPRGPLAHNFTSFIGSIYMLLREEASTHSSLLSPEKCQNMLREGILELRKIIRRIETNAEELENPEDKLDPTDKINPVILSNFIQFLNGFVEQYKKLTLEESNAIQIKFNEMFLDVIPKGEMTQGFNQG